MASRSPRARSECRTPHSAEARRGSGRRRGCAPNRAQGEERAVIGPPLRIRFPDGSETTPRARSRYSCALDESVDPAQSFRSTALSCRFVSSAGASRPYCLDRSARERASDRPLIVDKIVFSNDEHTEVIRPSPLFPTCSARAAPGGFVLNTGTRTAAPLDSCGACVSCGTTARRLRACQQYVTGCP